MKKVYATFKDSVKARNSILQLEAIQIPHKRINVIGSDTAVNSLGIEKHNKSSEGFATGSAVGGILGAILAGATAATAIAIPGINLVVYGVAVSAVLGAGAGGITGGLTGALIGLGLSEYEVKHYEKDFDKNSVFILVEAMDSEEADKVQDIFKKQDATKTEIK